MRYKLTNEYPELFKEISHILACPACGGNLVKGDNSIGCKNCEKIYPIETGIPLLFCPNDWKTENEDVTETVRQFYEDAPFPNYDDIDSRQTLQEKAQRGVFGRLLKQQIPEDSLCLEVGCGTGQMTNFLGMSHRNRIVGADLCLNSLRLAKGFRDRFRINNAAFLQMNLFRPPFRDETFDLILINGVLHHTSDPYGGFRNLLSKLKPSGIVIVGLYNRFGHLPTLWRRFLFRHFGSWLHFLDSRLKRESSNIDRKRSWFRDQYEHPHETKHSYTEVLTWFRNNRIEFLIGIPKPDGSIFLEDEMLFDPHKSGSPLDRWLTEMKMLLDGGRDSGLFIMIGRKVARLGKWQ